MADLSDVENAIASLIANLIYPNGLSAPSVLPGATPARIGRGWPVPGELDADLAIGKATVSVFSRGGTELNTTRYPVDFQTISEETATLTATVVNNTITIGGTNNPAITQYVTLIIGPRYVASYQSTPTDTLSSIAAALAAQIASEFTTAAAVGAVITISSGALIRALVGVTGQQLAEVRRQRTQIQITLWCKTPAIRDAIAVLVEPTLAQQTFLTMPDSSAARFRYNNTIVSDAAEKVNLYRRDLIYTAEYATTISDTAFEITSINTNIEGSQGSLGTAPVNNNFLPTQPGPTPVNARTPFVPHVPN